MSKKNIRFKRTRKLSMKEISLTPLIDTALTLLIIFMITVPIIGSKIDLDLPSADSSTEVNSTNNDNLKIDRKGDIYLNGNKITLDKLKLILSQKRLSKTVSIEADKNVFYGNVVEIIDLLKSNFIDSIEIVTSS